MLDQPSVDSSDSRPVSRQRLAMVAPILLVAAVIFGILVLWGGLAPAWAVGGWLILGLAAVLFGPIESGGVTSGLSPVDAGDLADVHAFADALGDPCLLLGRHGRIIHRNGAAANQYPNVAVGNPISFALRNPELLRAVDTVFATARPSVIELHETFPSETWNRVAIAPLHLPGREWFEDSERMLVVTFYNLTELKRVDAMRSDFVANASHELRTPLASLLGFIETLQGPAAGDEAARIRFLDIMRSQAQRMSNLIDDLLSLSRIEMYQHVRPTGRVDLAILLREVREGLEVKAKGSGVALELEVPAGIHETTGDREQLYEIFENIVDNAIKYGAEGQQVDIALTAATRQGYAHLVSVTDYGPGVAEDQVPRMTERFYRIDKNSSRKMKGTGLGLAIVKHIVQRHRGLMAIRSRPGEGLRIEIQLPQ